MNKWVLEKTKWKSYTDTSKYDTVSISKTVKSSEAVLNSQNTITKKESVTKIPKNDPRLPTIFLFAKEERDFLDPGGELASVLMTLHDWPVAHKLGLPVVLKTRNNEFKVVKRAKRCIFIFRQKIWTQKTYTNLILLLLGSEEGIGPRKLLSAKFL